VLHAAPRRLPAQRGTADRRRARTSQQNEAPGRVAERSSGRNALLRCGTQPQHGLATHRSPRPPASGPDPAERRRSMVRIGALHVTPTTGGIRILVTSPHPDTARITFGNACWGAVGNTGFEGSHWGSVTSR